MPGVASVKWSEENMAKALLALIGYGCVKVNNEEAQKVAAHLGKSIRINLLDRRS